MAIEFSLAHDYETEAVMPAEVEVSGDDLLKVAAKVNVQLREAKSRLAKEIDRANAHIEEMEKATLGLKVLQRVPKLGDTPVSME